MSKPFRCEKKPDHRFCVDDGPVAHQINGFAQWQMEHPHRLLLRSLPRVRDRLAPGGEVQMRGRVGHPRRWDDHRERVESLRAEPNFLGEFPNRGGLRRFTGNVAHSSGDFEHLTLEGRAVLLDQHNRRDPFGIEQQRNDADRPRRTHDVAHEDRAVGRLEIRDRNRPDMTLMDRAFSDATESGHGSDARVRAVRPGANERRIDQIPEQRVWSIRTALELGMRLSRDPEGVIGQLDELDEAPVG
jgi:hypothetical protein